MEPDFSVIIPVYNAELFLRDCVMSITQQEGISDCEIILINDVVFII